jgi:predicted NBD/HSP70 family sugar kinase
VDASTIVQRARKAEPIARAVLEQAARHVGLGFASLIMALNPEAIVLGDYLGEAWDVMEATVWGVLRNRVPAYYLTSLRMAPSRHGSDSALVGAAALVHSVVVGLQEARLQLLDRIFKQRKAIVSHAEGGRGVLVA